MFKPFGRSNPCPVCGKDNGDCRYSLEDTDFILCHTFADARKSEKINGYICIKESHGHTASFKPDNTAEWTVERQREWEAQKAARQQQKQEANAQQQQRALEAVERHKLYSEILSQLTLDTITLADLEKRGFSQAEIDACSFKSVAAWQPLQTKIDKRLPGIAQDGLTLAIKYDGYLCPLYDLEGRIVALQLRLCNPPDKNKYRWVSTPNTATLQLYPEGENPLTVLRPASKPKGIALAEGTGAKPFLLAQRLNLLVIGAAGGQWAYSPQLFKSWLEQAYQEVGGEKVITLYPDAGDVSNKDVVHRWRKASNLLVDWGWQVRFAWWGQIDKTFCDIDELEPEKFGLIRYLSVAEFKALCIKWGGLEESRENNNLVPLDYQQRVAQAQRKLHSLSYPIDLICDAHQKYLPNLVGQIPTKGLVALKAAKGSGKSHQIKLIKDLCCGYWVEKIIHPETSEIASEQLELFNKDKQRKNPENTSQKPQIERIRHKGLGMNFLSINARIALGREQAIRWEFTWIEDADLEAKTEFSGAKLSPISIVENIDEIGLCWDSLGKIFGRNWGNTLVVIDELELGLSHVSTSSTCRDRRSFILHTLELKLRECLDNNGLVIVADADLTDTSLDYLTTIAPGHPPFIVSHDFKGDPWEVDFYTGKRDVILSQIEEWLAEPTCRPIAIALDNQKEAEALSMHLTRKFPWLNTEQGGLIRIDSRITQTDSGKDFVKRPNESIQKYQPKVLIYTPSLGVGCSIDIEYFAHVFGLSFGNLEPSQARQMLARVRQSVPRTVWCKTSASNTENEATSYLPDEIKRRMFDYHDTTTVLINLAVNLAKERTESPDSDQDLLPNLIEVLQEMMGSNGTWNNPHIDLYCNQVARRNYALSQLAVQLRQELKDEGHIINDFGAESATNAGQAVRANKDEIKRRDAAMTAQSQDISFESAQEIKRKPARTIEEEFAASKAFLKRELPGAELTADFLYKAVYRDDRRTLNQVKLFWLYQNPDAVKQLDYKEWKHRLQQFSKGVPFLPDVKTYSTKVEALVKSGIFDLIDLDNPEHEYTESDPALQQFHKSAFKHRKLLKTGLRITVTRNSQRIKLVQRILSRIGLNLQHSRWQRQGSERLRYYKLDANLVLDPDRTTILEAMTRRWEDEKSNSKNQEANSPQSNAMQPLQPSQDSKDCLYINSSPVTENKPNEVNPNHVVSRATKLDEQVDVSQRESNDEWMQPDILQDVATMLNDCDNSQMLALLRRCAIPPYALKAASNLLSPQKRKQIREWVIS